MYRVVVQQASSKSRITNSLQALGWTLSSLLPQRAACRSDDQAPSEQWRAGAKQTWAARELSCHSPNPRELEMLSRSSVGRTQPHASASGLATRCARPARSYSSPRVLILPVVSLVLWPLVPTSSASVLQITKWLLWHLKGTKLQQKESKKEFPLTVYFQTTRRYL